MERVHQLLAEGTLDIENGTFWIKHWHHIASAKVPLETKVAAYRALRDRNVANINNVRLIDLYELLRSDRAFVTALDWSTSWAYLCRICISWIDDDVVTFARMNQGDMEDPRTAGFIAFHYLPLIWPTMHAPRCTRFVFQDKELREIMLTKPLSPLTQRLAEELVQPTDCLLRDPLLAYGQSVKLIGMCVEDEEMVAEWLRILTGFTPRDREWVSIPFARKLYALMTPEQSTTIKTDVLHAINQGALCDGYFELAWLLGLLGPFDPIVQACFLRNNISAFPAFIFAMIVAMCDGYLKVARGITESQKRFFDCMARLPMDLQALVALRLWEYPSIVIPREKFDRAFLAII